MPEFASLAALRAAAEGSQGTAALAAEDSGGAATVAEMAKVKALLNAEEQSRQAPTTREAVAPRPADTLIKEAEALAGLTAGQVEQANLFRQSVDTIRAHIQQNPNFDKVAAKELGQARGEEYVKKTVDLADSIRIDYMKRQFPDRFNAGDAASMAAFNTATAGQLSRFSGALSTLFPDGRSAEAHTREFAEEVRLLDKAFPKSSFYGKALGFMLPGSPVKLLFEKAAGVGVKGVAQLIQRIAKNPELLQSLPGAIARSAAGGAAGGAAVGAVEGTLGRDNMRFGKLDRALGDTVVGAVGGGLMGAALPPVGRALGYGIEEYGAPLVRKLAHQIEKQTGRVVGELTNMPGVSQPMENAIRAANRDADAVRRAYKSELEIGQDMADFLFDFDQSRIPELGAAEKLLGRLPDVDPSRLLNSLYNRGKTLNKEEDPAVKAILEWARRIDAEVARDPKLMAQAQERVARARDIFNKVVDNKARELAAKAEAAEGKIATAEAKSKAANLVHGDVSFAGQRKAAEAEAQAQGKALDKWTQGERARLDQFEAQEIAGVPRIGKISAQQMAFFKKKLQDAAGDEWGKKSAYYARAVKLASRDARLSILEAAEKEASGARLNPASEGFTASEAPSEGGGVGRLYVNLMQKVQEKVKVLEFMRKQMGRTKEKAELRMEGWFDRIFGRNKQLQQIRLAQLETFFKNELGEGPGFLERAKLAQYAQQLGPGGELSYFSQSPTGRSALGTKVGEAVGGAVGAIGGAALGFVGSRAFPAGIPGIEMGGAAAGAVLGKQIGEATGRAAGLAASSPRLGALIIGTADSISGFMRRLVAEPEVIARLAGRLPQGGPGQARLSVPWEVRRFAEMIQDTITKDGPESAGGVVRLIADTPYYAGLLHYWELMHRRQRGADIRGALPALQQQQASGPTQGGQQ